MACPVDGLDDLPEVLMGLGADFAQSVPAARDLVAWWNERVAAPQIPDAWLRCDSDLPLTVVG